MMCDFWYPLHYKSKLCRGCKDYFVGFTEILQYNHLILNVNKNVSHSSLLQRKKKILGTAIEIVSKVKLMSI